jgi:hypothetical protein
LNCSLFASPHQFALFCGWVPHKTEGEDKGSHRSHGKMVKASRVHHSVLSKREIEFLAFSAFRSDSIIGVVESAKNNNWKT